MFPIVNHEVTTGCSSIEHSTLSNLLHRMEDIMDGLSFDKLSRIVARSSTRRSALGALAAAGIGGAMLPSDADAKGKGKKKRKRKCKKVEGKPCTSDKTCCKGKTNNICAVPVNGSNDDTFCCGGAGAKCGGKNDDEDAVAPYCCNGFECNVTGPGVFGSCQPLPVE